MSCAKENPVIPPPAPPPVSDYFPLHFGNRWTYATWSSYRSGFSGASSERWGRLSWIIVSVDSFFRYVDYTIEGFRDDTTISLFYRSGIPVRDTTYFRGRDGGFIIEEDIFHRLTISDTARYPWRDAFVLNVISRYQPAASPDTLEFSGADQNGKTRLLKSVGIVRAWSGLRTMDYVSSDMRLVEAVLYDR